VTAPVSNTSTGAAAAPGDYADFQGLEAVRRGVRADDKNSIREAARQFESLFTNMMLKAMREASAGESLGDSEQVQFYQDMFDQQLSVQLAKGDGMGLATRLMEQLNRDSAARAPVNEVSQADFVQQIRPLAEQAAQRLGVAPEAVIAQAALETGWGRHMPVDAQGNGLNFFGIKAGSSWQGDQLSAMTREVTQGQAQNMVQNFRSYDTAAAGVNDYVSLVGGSPRYSAALNTGNDVRAFATALKEGGYATDPDYVNKLVATAHSVRQHLNGTTLKLDPSSPIAAQRIS
jgi:flagellar protein FlgJ